MNKIKFNLLCKEMQKVIKAKAEECECSVKQYLTTTDDNYCILSTNAENLVVCWGNGDLPFDYIVYGSESEAHQDCGLNDKIVTETVAIDILNTKISK